MAISAFPCRIFSLSTLKEIVPPLVPLLYLMSVTSEGASCQTSSALRGRNLYFSDIRVGYAIAKMINERVQRPLYGSLRRVCRVIDLSIIDGIAVYQRERIRARCIYDVTVCRVFHVCRTRTVRQVVRNGFRTFLCCCTKGCRMYTLGYTGLWSNFSVKEVAVSLPVPLEVNSVSQPGLVLLHVFPLLVEYWVVHSTGSIIP